MSSREGTIVVGGRARARGRSVAVPRRWAGGLRAALRAWLAAGYVGPDHDRELSRWAGARV